MTIDKRGRTMMTSGWRSPAAMSAMIAAAAFAAAGMESTPADRPPPAPPGPPPEPPAPHRPKMIRVESDDHLAGINRARMARARKNKKRAADFAKQEAGKQK